ncbi:MAG: helix-hairpin-helix domain-containing protein [Sediminibacterium sp.]|nr:helix-hairpin-helix domain-containing protein [Sediminibacterium sp.]
MTNDDVCEALELTGKLLELHGENPFKTKAYANAAYKLGKLRYDFEGKTLQDIESIEGIGKSIASKIAELLETGTTNELQGLLQKTPPGIIDLFSIKGLGVKKVSQLWQELGIESVGELLYACNENRLVSLKGFGAKTQDGIKGAIEFRQANTQKLHYATVERLLPAMLELLSKQQGLRAEVVGQVRRKCEVIDKIEILLNADKAINTDSIEAQLPVPVVYHICEPENYVYNLVALTGTGSHLEKIGFKSLAPGHFQSEKDVYKALGFPLPEPETREGLEEIKCLASGSWPQLIDTADLKGILHNHSTYSDGVNTLKEMADYCRELGYSYFGICDHSRSAGYAGGLSIDRVLEQQSEIDRLNAGYTDFTILKGIESDILGDGSLDYPEDVLKTFDFIVASIHSNLKMDEERATERLIRAIENPYTSILGHPTGRLLLARPGYPIQHRKVIDACAANKVSIELNAHPYRLDIDWRWIHCCMEKGVKVSINPDAHQKAGFHDMYYGVCVARKGLLTKEHCLNALSLTQLLKVFAKQ